MHWYRGMGGKGSLGLKIWWAGRKHIDEEDPCLWDVCVYVFMVDVGVGVFLLCGCLCVHGVFTCVAVFR